MKKTDNKIIFIGALDLSDRFIDAASSSAGNQVQSEIINELKILNENGTTKTYSIKQIRSWPKGLFYWKGFKNNEFCMPPFINITGIKRFIFSIFLLFNLLSNKPRIIVKYNISLFEAIAILLYKKLYPSTFLTCIIQDVHCSNMNGVSIKQAAEQIAMKLVSRFDMLIPISEKIKNDFSFPPEKTLVFNGGLTRQGRYFLSTKNESINSYAVFAGSLVPYNGIELLIKKWTTEKINIDLHIFGRGTSEPLIRNAAALNSRIKFHGFKSEDEICNWQKLALINFCLRYPIGIDVGYFFPSKLFNIICAPGAVMVNEFDGFPSELKDSCLVLSDDLSNLSERIENAKQHSELLAMRQLRRKWIEENGSWSTVVRDIYQRAESAKDLI